jgi:hypothetical protein
LLLFLCHGGGACSTNWQALGSPPAVKKLECKWKPSEKLIFKLQLATPSLFGERVSRHRHTDRYKSAEHSRIEQVFRGLKPDLLIKFRSRRAYRRDRFDVLAWKPC